MTNKVKAIPEGYSAVTPYLIIKGAADAIEFYKKVFSATERMRFASPDGKIHHAEINIGNSVIMLADECPEMQAFAPTNGRSPVLIHLYVENVDAVFAKATAAGAKIIQPLQNQFYGDRSGCLADPYGHIWGVATHIEDVPPEEMQKRSEEYMKKAST